jgi:hypothetical protein
MRADDVKNAREPWSLEDVTTLYEHRQMGTPYSEIAILLGRTNQACRDKYRNTNWAETGIPDRIQEKIKQRRTDSFAEYNKVLADNRLAVHKQRTDLISDKLCQAARELPDPPLVPWTPRTQKEGTPEHMAIVLSDLHIGHDHSYEETGGLSEYNLEIFLRRMKNLQFAVADMYQRHSAMYKIPELHVFCLGDIVDGMNAAGKWSPVYISTDIFHQVMTGVRALSDSLWYWATIFEKVNFYGIRGNHGRVAPSGLEKDYCNWDIIIYEMMNAEFRNANRVTFDIPRAWFKVANVQDHNFLLCHGDDVRGKGMPIQGLLETKNKMQATLNERLHYAVCGHFHNAGEVTSHTGRVLMNGSFVGSDVYSLKNNLPGTRAEQKLFGISSNNGITYSYNIDLDFPRNHPDDSSSGLGNTVSE